MFYTINPLPHCLSSSKFLCYDFVYKLQIVPGAFNQCAIISVRDKPSRVHIPAYTSIVRCRRRNKKNFSYIRRHAGKYV